MYFDLNLPHDGDIESLRARLATALSMGYTTVAVTFVTDRAKLTHDHRPRWTPMDMSALLGAGSGRKSRQQPTISDETGNSAVGASVRGFRQLSRLTVVLDTPAQCADLAGSSAVAREHDVFAVRPTSERALATCCTTLDVDVISLDLGQRLPFKLRPQLVKAAVQRGVVFEICYAPLIGDATGRRQLLSNAISLVRACGGVALVSSGAGSASDMRPPADIANLGTLFGLSAGAGKEAVSVVAQGVLDAAFRRRQGKGTQMVQRLPPLQGQLATAPARNTGTAGGGGSAASSGRAPGDGAAAPSDWGGSGVLSLSSGANGEAGAATTLEGRQRPSADDRWPAIPLIVAEQAGDVTGTAPDDRASLSEFRAIPQTAEALLAPESAREKGLGKQLGAAAPPLSAAPPSAVEDGGKDDDDGAVVEAMLLDDADYFLHQPPPL